MTLLPIAGPPSLPFSLANLTDDGVSFTDSDLQGRSLTLKPDGTQIFTLGDSSEIAVLNLSTAWDLSTATKGTFLTPDQAIGSYGLTFNGDGSKVFALNEGGSLIQEFDLSGAYSGTVTRSATLAGPVASVGAFEFNADGNKIVVHDQRNFYDVALGTAYDLTTAGSWSTALAEPLATGKDLLGFTFGRSGRQLVIPHEITSSAFIKEFSMTAEYDVSTQSFARSVSVSDYYDDIEYGFGGRKLYTARGDTITQFSTVS